MIPTRRHTLPHGQQHYCTHTNTHTQARHIRRNVPKGEERQSWIVRWAVSHPFFLSWFIPHMFFCIYSPSLSAPSCSAGLRECDFREIATFYRFFWSLKQNPHPKKCWHYLWKRASIVWENFINSFADAQYTLCSYTDDHSAIQSHLCGTVTELRLEHARLLADAQISAQMHQMQMSAMCTNDSNNEEWNVINTEKQAYSYSSVNVITYIKETGLFEQGQTWERYLKRCLSYR